MLQDERLKGNGWPRIGPSGSLAQQDWGTHVALCFQITAEAGINRSERLVANDFPKHQFWL